MAKTIDPIYKRYVSRVVKYMSSTEFYDYFMQMVNVGKNTFQFSNRKIEKSVDAEWVIAIEKVMKPMEEIINNPRNFIQQEEIIVNVALAKRVTPDSIRHLAQHGDMIDTVTEDSVRPNRLMNKIKEDSWNTYENRFVYTLLDMAYEFVDKRYEAIFASLNEEEGAFLKMETEFGNYYERVTGNVDLRIRQEEDLLASDKKNENIFSRIARLYRLLGNYKRSKFALEMEKYGKIRPPLIRTNAIAKNPNFKACHKLWNFIMTYKDVGYNIHIYEQNNEIDDVFMTDIFHSIMFNYIILKNYLETARDREIDMTQRIKKRRLKPKFIKDIIEEIVQSYDLPDVEVRKVLIEEITKAQLMQEEEKERLRLVEEKEKEMREKALLEKKEKERLEKLRRKEELRRIKEEEKKRLAEERRAKQEALRREREKEQKEQEDYRKGERIAAELERMKVERVQMLERLEKQEQALTAKLKREKQEQEKLRRQQEQQKKRQLREEQEQKLKEEQVEEPDDKKTPPAPKPKLKTSNSATKKTAEAKENLKTQAKKTTETKKPKQKPKAEPKPEPKDEATPKATVEPEVIAEAGPTPKATVEPEVIAEAKPTPKATVEPEVIAEAGPTPKVTVEPEVIAEAGSTPKATVEPEVIAEEKTDAEQPTNGIKQMIAKILGNGNKE